MSAGLRIGLVLVMFPIKISNKLIAVLVVVLVFVALLSALFVTRYQHALIKDKLAGEIERSVGLDVKIKHVAALREQEGAARTELLKQLKVSKDEIETLRNDLADKRKRLSVGAICPGVPEASGGGRVEAVAATLDARAERAYLHLRELIAENEAWVGMCFKLVNAQ